jgi:transcriptional regulator with XRE-family HTH domain
MAALSSTASRESQAPLHLQRKAALYAVDMTLGKLIQKARTAKGWSLQKLADEIGVTRQLVWQWEKGDTDARKHIEGLSKALKVPVDYFYGPAGSPPPIEAKIKLLSPSHQQFIEKMIDTFLEQQEQESVPTVKKA